MGDDTFVVLSMGSILALNALLCYSVLKAERGLKYLSVRVADLEAKLSDSNVTNNATSFYDRLRNLDFSMAHFADFLMVLLALFVVFAVIRHFQLELEEVKAEKAMIFTELMAARDAESESSLDIHELEELEEVRAEKAEVLTELAATKEKEAKARLEIQDLKNQIKLIKADYKHALEKVNIAEARVADGMEAVKRSEERVSEYQAAAAKAAADAEARADKAAADAEDRVSEQTKLAFDLSEAVKAQVKQTLVDSDATKKLVKEITNRLPLMEVEAFSRGREAGLAEARLSAGRN